MLAHVISIWPEELRASRNLFQPATNYNDSNQFFIPKAHENDPKVLNVGAFKQKERIQDKWIEQMVSAEDLARDITKEWSANRDERVLGQPGVFVWEGVDNPTIEQIKASEQYANYARMQRVFAHEEVEKAREYYKNDDYREITALMFLCADYLKIENEEWQARKLTDTASRIACPVCTKPINVAAMKCPHCNEIVNAKKYRAYLEANARELAGETPAPAQPLGSQPQQPPIKRQ